MENILLNKKQCEWIDNGFHQSWKVKMPRSSKHYGYAFTVSPYLLSETSNDEVLRLKKPQKEDFVFVLAKIEREEGKRYPRPKLSWQELCEDLAEHSAKNDKNTLPQGLVYIYDYDYRHGIELGRDGHYALGGVEGCWFWENGIKRRRTSAKNFRLLRMLEAGELEDVKAKLDRLRAIGCELARTDSIEKQFDRIKLEIEHRVKILQPASDTFLAQLVAAREELEKERAAIISELERNN